MHDGRSWWETLFRAQVKCIIPSIPKFVAKSLLQWIKLACAMSGAINPTCDTVRARFFMRSDSHEREKILRRTRLLLETIQPSQDWPSIIRSRGQCLSPNGFLKVVLAMLNCGLSFYMNLFSFDNCLSVYN